MATFNIGSTDVDVLNQFGDNVKGRTILITGPSQSGIGAQVALSLATASPKLLILAGRNAQNIASVVDEILSINPNLQIKFVPLDLLSNESVRQAVGQITACTKIIDILINNAGVMGTRNFLLSENGVEHQFAVNYLGHFLLTNLLLEEGVVGMGGMVLNIGSLGYQMADIHFDDINFRNGENYNGWRAYGQAKSAQLLGTRGLANRMKGHRITVLAAHLGVTLESKLLANSAIDQDYFGEAYAIAIERNDGKPLPPQNMVSIKQAAGVVLYTMLNPKLTENSGAFIVEYEIYKETRDYANNDADAEKLWKLSEELVGQKFEF